jgi:hypothetical protein
MMRCCSKQRRAGAALVIVLAFIVLLASLMVIFFAQAISYRNQGNSSSNNFKSAALAQSGLETVVGDLQQEITNGSQAVAYGSGTNVFYVTNNAYAIPQRSGNPTYSGNADPAPNLVRISVRTETYPLTGGFTPAVSSRASADSSTNAAASGQYVSAARWNQHYLLPRQNAGSTTIDTTPTNAFSAPDWVYITSKGPQTVTAANISTGTKVIGRYAYAIYNEGGLLDANVAGFPSDTATNSVHPASPITFATNSYGGPSPMWGSGLKGSQAFADLTVPIPVGSSTSPMFTQTQIDQLVGWRNNATAQPTGTYNNYTFNSTSAVNYHDWAANTTNGYLATSGNSWSDPTTGKTDTDQVFASRQALINFINDAGMSQDALQYLATFTRTLDQPVYNPPVGRPMVQNSTNSTGNLTPFGSGNDAYSFDRQSTATNSPGDINPPILAVRVTTGGWLRADNTSAVVGEPLIKERFPLSRLSLFPVNEGTVSGTVATQIYNYFGLTQVSSGVWQYNHDSTNPGGIDRLSVVASLGREPDFFELLKAAINIGSVGKGSWLNSNNFPANFTATGAAYTSGNLQQSRDVLTAVQILQLGANIIDQSKADDFPTRIQCTGLPTVCGVEDLPYLYRFRFWLMEMPGPASAGTGSVQGQMLLLPELWNPHTPTSSALVPGANMPKNFRIRLLQDPSCNAAPISAVLSYGKGAGSQSSTISSDNITAGPTGYYDGITLNSPNYSSTSPPAPLTFNAGAANGYWDFREPTLLAQPNTPSGSNLAGGSPAQATGTSPLQTITGLQLALFYWYYQSYTATSLYFNKINIGSTGSNSCIRFYLDYQDANAPGGWVTYDQQQYQFDATQLAISGTPSSFNNGQNWGGGGRVDPRTSRWGYHISEYQTDIPVINLADNEYGTYRPDGGGSYGDHVGGRADLGFVGAETANSGGAGDPWQGFQNGYWAENSVRSVYEPASSTPVLHYNVDPDGVPRRAVGGYVTDTSEGGTAISSSEPLTGLPMATGATTISGGDTAYDSRPTMLHRPFRSVAELGYVFRDSPWGDINFTFPESGDSPLLDVFCINDTSATAGLVAGRVDLNTRQAPVLAALLSGTLLDKDNSNSPILSQAMASQLAAQLVARTMTTTTTGTSQGPLLSRADLVGTWMGSTNPTTSGSNLKTVAAAQTINPDNFFTGFSHDIGSATVPSINTQLGGGNPNPVALIPRQRNSAMRGLVDNGMTRTWDLLIDLIAQSGEFPPKATGFSNFVVEGEKHYWLHVAIDRYTGKIIGSQLEVVSE